MLLHFSACLGSKLPPTSQCPLHRELLHEKGGALSVAKVLTQEWRGRTCGAVGVVRQAVWGSVYEAACTWDCVCMCVCVCACVSVALKGPDLCGCQSYDSERAWLCMCMYECAYVCVCMSVGSERADLCACQDYDADRTGVRWPVRVNVCVLCV